MTQPDAPESTENSRAFFPSGMSTISVIFPIVSTVLVFLVYFLGFIVFNVHISQFGYFLDDLLGPRSVIAGLIFFFFIACFSIFAGRYAVLAKSQLAEDLDFLRSVGCGPFWYSMKFLESQLKVFILLALSVLSFCSITVHTSHGFLFIIVFVAWFLIIYPMDVANWDISRPRLFLSASLLRASTGIVVLAYVIIHDRNFRDVYISYFGMFIVINMVLDGIERYRLTSERIFFTIVFMGVLLLTTAAGFGAVVFGKVSYRIGGGMPIKADLFLDSEASLRIGVSTGMLAEARIYYMEGDLIILRTETGQIYLVRSEDVNMLKLRPEFLPALGDKYVNFIFEKTWNAN